KGDDGTQILFGLTLLFITIIFIFTYAIASFNLTSIQNKEFKSKKRHIAIIISNYQFYKHVSYLLVKIRTLLKNLRKESIPYKVYIIEKPVDFNKIIKKNIYGLIIFGHGTKHGLKIKDNIHYYCETKKNNNIKFAVQLHCNKGGKNSIKKYLNCKEFYPSNKIRTAKGINKIITSEEFIKKINKTK
ncbi:MAG: hypothetical protein ACLFTH_04885, partial [Candidatus Woesearchaeota archaeon]